MVHLQKQSLCWPPSRLTFDKVVFLQHCWWQQWGHLWQINQSWNKVFQPDNNYCCSCKGIGQCVIYCIWGLPLKKRKSSVFSKSNYNSFLFPTSMYVNIWSRMAPSTKITSQHNFAALLLPMGVQSTNKTSQIPHTKYNISNCQINHPEYLDALHVKVAIHRGPVNISRLASVLVPLDSFLLAWTINENTKSKFWFQAQARRWQYLFSWTTYIWLHKSDTKPNNKSDYETSRLI